MRQGKLSKKALKEVSKQKNSAQFHCRAYKLAESLIQLIFATNYYIAKREFTLSCLYILAQQPHYYGYIPVAMV